MHTAPMSDLSEVSLIRTRKSDVLDSWHREVLAEVSDLQRLTASLLRDPVEVLIDRIADWLEGDVNSPTTLLSAVEQHTGQRFRHGFTINSVVREYARLRHCLLVELNNVELGLQLDDAIDLAIEHATNRYTIQREELRERLIGVLAHDLRNPLACVTMASEMLLDAERTARERSLITLVLECSDQMQRMVNDVLSWARVSSGERFPIVARDEDMGSIVRQVIEEARFIHGEQAVTCNMSGDLRAELDRDRVHQVITNLVRNAIEHGAGTADVDVSHDENAQAIVLVVRNQAPARSPSMSDVMDPFRRRKRPSNARGLGLYIVDQIARAHGATVEMTSLGQDTAITIRWPTRRTTGAQ
jgi:signal transduction histidine kinase